MANLVYFDKIMPIIEEAIETQSGKLRQLAEWMADTIIKDHMMYVFGAGHAGIISEELCYRAGGLVPINAIFAPGLTLNTRPLTLETELERISGYAAIILDTSGIMPGDLLLVHSNSGRNTVSIEIAEIAREKNIRVVGLTSVSHSKKVKSRHPRGIKLMDVADLVIDNCGIPGDAIVEYTNFSQKCGASSTVVGAILMNAAVCETVQILLEKGFPPPVTKSANMDDNEVYNQMIWDHYKGRLTYL